MLAIIAGILTMNQMVPGATQLTLAQDGSTVIFQDAPTGSGDLDYGEIRLNNKRPMLNELGYLNLLRINIACNAGVELQMSSINCNFIN